MVNGQWSMARGGCRRVGQSGDNDSFVTQSLNQPAIFCVHLVFLAPLNEKIPSPFQDEGTRGAT
jgi:hypothetical protein